MSSTMSGYSPNKSIRLQDARVPKRGTLQTSNSSNLSNSSNTEHGTRNAKLFILPADPALTASSFPPIADDSTHPP